MYALTDFDEPGTGDYYQIPVKNNQTTIQDPYIYNAGGKDILITSIVTPISMSRTNTVFGAIGIDIDIDVIQQIAQSHHPFGTGINAIFSNKGIIASHFDPGRLGKNMLETEKDMAGKYLDNFTDAIRNGKLLTFTNYITSAKAEFNIVCTPIDIGETPWSYAIAVPTKTVMASMIQMEIITVIICLIILALVIPAAIFLARSLSKPIIEVAETLKDISEGEGDLTRTIIVKSKDEIGNLAFYFNKTLGKIKDLVITIKGKAKELIEIGSELATNMNQTAAAINEITANIQSIKVRVINQSASVTETNATMEQISANINKLNNHIENQTGAVSQSSSAIEQMLANINSVTQILVKNAENVSSLSSASEIGRYGMQEVAADIKDVARESESLMEINAVIKNIASQTNLLSMNAAIEAAHAGDAGKGFAVVADEIRKLAENSGEQTKTIGTALQKIKNSMDKITKSTENVLDKFEAIDKNVKTVADQEVVIRNAMEEQGLGSKQIHNSISNLNDLTQEVGSESNEMLGGAKEVISESKNLEMMTQEITSGVNEMATGAEQINIAVNRVNDLTIKNRENIDLLSNEVSRFKVE